MKILSASLALAFLLLFSFECPAQGSARIRISVTDKNGNAVLGLAKEDLSLFEEKTPLEITAVQSQAEKPCAFLILVDNSVSQEKVIPQAKKFAVSFINSGLRKDDLIGVAGFSDSFESLQPFTNNFAEVVSVIAGIRIKVPVGYLGGGVISGKAPKGPVNLQGATGLWAALSAIGKNDFYGTGDRRKIVILLTDGFDTSSKVKLEEASDDLNKAGITVFAVGMGDEYYQGINRSALKKIAAATGGGEFFPRDEKDFSAMLEKLKQRIISEYALTFTAAANGKDKPGKLKLQMISTDKTRQAYEISYPQRYSAGK